MVNDHGFRFVEDAAPALSELLLLEPHAASKRLASTATISPVIAVLR